VRHVPTNFPGEFVTGGLSDPEGTAELSSRFTFGGFSRPYGTQYPTGPIMGRMAVINDDVSVRQRLHTVEQRECGQARREQDEIGAAERRCAAPNVGGRILRCYQGQLPRSKLLYCDAARSPQPEMAYHNRVARCQLSAAVSLADLLAVPAAGQLPQGSPISMEFGRQSTLRTGISKLMGRAQDRRPCERSARFLRAWNGWAILVAIGKAAGG